MALWPLNFPNINIWYAMFLKYAQALGQALLAIIDRGHLWKKAFTSYEWRGSFPRWLYLSQSYICMAKDSWQPCTLKVEILVTPHSLEFLISNNFNLEISIRGSKFSLSDSMPGLINHKPIGVGFPKDFLSWLPLILSLLAYMYAHIHIHEVFNNRLTWLPSKNPKGNDGPNYCKVYEPCYTYSMLRLFGIS